MTTKGPEREARSTRPIRLRAAAAGCALSMLAAVAQADDGAVTATYDMSLAGVTIGGATLAAKVDGPSYTIDVHAKLTGLAGVLTSGKGGAKAAGSLNGANLLPASLAVISSTSDMTRTLRLAFGAGRVEAIEIKPPLDDWDRPDRVPLREADKRGVIDPLSALLMPVAAGADPAAACRRSIPVFDGATRFDVVLTFTKIAQVSRGSYRGPAVVCAARYVPVSGHRPLRSGTKFMMENRDMSVWLIPVASTNVYVPYRVSVKTQIGTAVLQASKLTIAGTRSASVPGARPK